MVDRFVAELQDGISAPRREAYRPIDGSDLDMIVNYLWNIELAEAIVPTLHGCEVVLRNAIHKAISDATGNDMWFFQEGLLLPDELQDFVAAYRRVYKKPPPIAGRIVAQLIFGFWTVMRQSRASAHSFQRGEV